MESDLSYQHPSEEERALVRKSETQALKPTYFLPFDVQLQNTFCLEIIARRFPGDIQNLPHIQVNLEDTQVDIQNSQAQVTLCVRTVTHNKPPPFDISFKLLGLFSYTENYSEEEARLFLDQGSLSILLPFARELLLSICNRLQVPPMMLTMVKIVPHPSLSKSSDEKNFNNE